MSMLEITGSLEPKKTAPVRTFLDDWKSFSNEKEQSIIYIYRISSLAHTVTTANCILPFPIKQTLQLK